MSRLRHCSSFMFACCVFAAEATGQGIMTTAVGTNIVFPTGGRAIEMPLGPMRGIAVDASGNLFAADSGNSVIVKISPSGGLTVAAGNGLHGLSGDGGPATSGRLWLQEFPGSPWFTRGVAVDEAGNLYIADTINRRIRKVSSSGVITSLAGGGPPHRLPVMGDPLSAHF